MELCGEGEGPTSSELHLQIEGADVVTGPSLQGSDGNIEFYLIFNRFQKIGRDLGMNT